jgi:hypothetical protein
MKNVTNGPVTLKQESTYNPGITDGFWRWLGSIAMDHSGNMALGFRSSDAINPQIRYAARLSTNPLNKLVVKPISLMALAVNSALAIAGAITAP